MTEKGMITKEEAKRRAEPSFQLQPTMDATIAKATEELGERPKLKVLAHLNRNEAVILSIGLAWDKFSSTPEDTSFVGELFDNLGQMSPARGGIGRKQITQIATAHAGGGQEEKEGRIARFMKWAGFRGD